MLQSLDHLCGISLQYVYVCLILGSLEMDTALQVWPHLSAEQRGSIDSFCLLALFLLMQPRMLLTFFTVRAHCWLMFGLVSMKTFSAKLLSNSLVARLWWCIGFYSTPGTGLLILLCWTLWCSCQPIFLQPVKVPLDSSMTLWLISHSSPFCVICKLAQGALCPIVQVINEEVKWH